MSDSKEPTTTDSPPDGKPPSGPLGIVLPPDPAVAAEACRLISDANLNVEDLSSCVCQDPVIVIELLKTANAMFYSGGRPPITSPRTAIVRLGQKHVTELINEIVARKSTFTPEVRLWLEIHRSRCRRASIVARMLAEVAIKNFSDECQVAGLLSFIGEMIAAAHFKEDYVKLAEEQARSSVNYRLAQDHKFDISKMTLSYLRRFGIPEVIMVAIDREALSRQPERAVMKPVVMAADELIDAFDLNRWEKLAPGRTLPSMSALRLLQITDGQYAKIYERASEYLFSMRIVEEKKKQRIKSATSEVLSAGKSTPGDDIGSWSTGMDADLNAELGSSLQAEIEGLMSALSPAEPPPPPPSTGSLEPPKKISTPGSKTSPAVLSQDFGIAKPSIPPPARVTAPSPKKTVAPPPMANPGSVKSVAKFASAIDSATSAETLIADILDMLIGDGLFQKSALIVVAKDKSKALVVAARGPNITNGQTILINDPLSPLAECFSKVQSFGNKESKVSPFGSKAFALSPIDAPHDTPVALYADCGNEGVIPFEARRIFRNVIDILNEKLPYLPGSLPIEI